MGLALDPGIIVQNRWCAKVSESFLDHPPDLRALRDIGAEGERLSSLSFNGGDRLSHLGFVDIDRRHLCAFASEEQGGGFPHARPGAGD